MASWRMRTIAALSLLAVLVVAASLAAQQGQRTQDGRRRRPILAELSDVLTHTPLGPCAPGARLVADGKTRVRVASWNIRAARTAPVDALAAELRAMNADVVALQEVDVGTRRGGFVDTPAMLAAALGFHFVFAASIKWDEGDYGLAVLSRGRLQEVRRHRLEFTPGTEPRIVLEVIACAGGRPLRLFNHHADRRVASRKSGFAALRRIAHAGKGSGILVVGDLNEYPDGPGVRSLIDDGFIDLGAESALNTTAHGRIDYLLADGPLARMASKARVWPTDKSDHHAVLTDLEW